MTRAPFRTASTGRPFPFTSLDRYILAQETSELPMNSHLIVDLRGPADHARIVAAARSLFTEIPILRSYVENREEGSVARPERFFADVPWFDPADQVTFHDVWSEDVFEDYLHQPFDLEGSPPFRILCIARPSGGERLVLAVHHSAFDGAAQAFLLELFFQAYAGERLPDWAKSTQPFSFRPLLARMGYPAAARQTARALGEAFVKKRPRAASLVAHPASTSRRVAAEVFTLNAEDQRRLLARTVAAGLATPTQTLLLSAAKALDRWTRERGDSRSPVVFALASSLRFALRAHVGRCFQNVVSLTMVDFTRPEIGGAGFEAIVRQRVTDVGTLQVSSRIPLLSAALARAIPFARLSATARKNDADPQRIRSSALVSGGTIPTSKVAHGLAIEKIFGRIALSKSPGVSLLLTGQSAAQTLTVQYLRDLVPRDAVAAWIEDTLEEMGLTAGPLRERGRV